MSVASTVVWHWGNDTAVKGAPRTRTNRTHGSLPLLCSLCSPISPTPRSWTPSETDRDGDREQVTHTWWDGRQSSERRADASGVNPNENPANPVNDICSRESDFLIHSTVVHQSRHFRTHHRRRDRISSKQLETLQLGPSADAAGAAEGKHPWAPILISHIQGCTGAETSLPAMSSPSLRGVLLLISKTLATQNLAVGWPGAGN